MAKREYTPKTVTATCQECGVFFAYQHSTGVRKKHCSEKCRVAYQIARAKVRKTEYPKCSIDGCCNPATRVGAGLCETHYCRIRRTGVPGKRAAVGRYVTGAGYIKLLSPSHPLADKGGHVFEHRAVAYISHDGMCPGCHWCGIKLDWPIAVVDHLNENKADNEPSNLVVTCNDCNRARGALLPLVTRLRPDVLDQFIGLVREHHERTSHTPTGA